MLRVYVPPTHHEPGAKATRTLVNIGHASLPSTHLCSLGALSPRLPVTKPRIAHTVSGWRRIGSYPELLSVRELHASSRRQLGSRLAAQPVQPSHGHPQLWRIHSAGPSPVQNSSDAGTRALLPLRLSVAASQPPSIRLRETGRPDAGTIATRPEADFDPLAQVAHRRR